MAACVNLLLDRRYLKYKFFVILIRMMSFVFHHSVVGDDSHACQVCDLSAFPDKPLQLVKPDSTHKNLVIIKENAAIIQKISGPVATIAVVGKFHSGKSFLMNQLMGKSNGFGIGPSVQPETMGIWMWGKPWIMDLPSGQKVSVLFLDTEGFAANNVSENYDAKIFAVATLMSSYLLYNSVKIIDQADIDYLELLARRTQLFALRSQMSRSKWTDEFIHDLLNFPPLLWIVQDFVQTTDETAQEWIHQLMETHTRENEDYEINLMGIFRSVDCHTLFLPATKKLLLTDLSLATEDDLTPEYKDERDELIDKLKNQIMLKEKNSKPITGAELAMLFEILVTAANEGSLAEIPTRWTAFIERIKQTAMEDCFKFYVAEMTALSNRHNNGPIKRKELEEWHMQSFGKSMKLLLQLLFGLEDAIVEAKQKLTEGVSSFYEKASELNEKKIRLRCQELQNQMELNAEEAIGSVSVPTTTTLLHNNIDSIITKIKTQFLVELGDLVEPEIRDKNLASLHNTVLNLGKSLQLKNNKEIEFYLQNEVNTSLEKFQKGTKSEGNIPRTSTQLKKFIQDGSSDAIQAFEKQCLKFKEENLYLPYLSVLKSHMIDHAKELEEKNEVLLKNYVETKVEQLLKKFELSTSSTKIHLPMNSTDLESKLNSEMNRIEREYKNILEDYISYEIYHSGLKQLQQLISAVCDQRKEENIQAFTREVEMPLQNSKQIILLSADKYSTEFSLKTFMKTICTIHLNEGKPKYWSSELKENIIEHFIQSDSDLRQALEMRSGWMSSIVGFFQWLLWLLKNILNFT